MSGSSVTDQAIAFPRRVEDRPAARTLPPAQEPFLGEEVFCEDVPEAATVATLAVLAVSVLALLSLLATIAKRVRDAEQAVVTANRLRDGAVLGSVVDHTARQFARAIVMPNLVPPVTTVAAAEAYRARIRAAVSPGLDFTPLMTCYLTDGMDPQEVETGFAAGVFTACKLYPAHATTNSSHGVTDIRNIYGVLEAMQRIGMS
eukprot:gene15246-20202_t